MWQFHHSEFIPVQSCPHFSPEYGVFTIMRFSYIKNKDPRLWIVLAGDNLCADIDWTLYILYTRSVPIRRLLHTTTNSMIWWSVIRSTSPVLNWVPTFSKDDMEECHSIEPIELTAFRDCFSKETPTRSKNNPWLATAVCKYIGFSAATSNLQQFQAVYTFHWNSNNHRCPDSLFNRNGHLSWRCCTRSDNIFRWWKSSSFRACSICPSRWCRDQRKHACLQYEERFWLRVFGMYSH